MSEAQRLLLELIRYANRNDIMLDIRSVATIRNNLGITHQETLEMDEVLEADTRERFAQHPDFGDLISDMHNLRKRVEG